MGDEYEWQQELIGTRCATGSRMFTNAASGCSNTVLPESGKTFMTNLIGFLDDEDTMDAESLEPAPITGVDGTKTFSLLGKLAEGEPLSPARFVDRSGAIRDGQG